MGQDLKRGGIRAIASLAMAGPLALHGISSWNLASAQPPNKDLSVAQLFYPPANDQKIIRVIGKGQARQAADIADIKILVDEISSFDDSPSFNPSFPDIPPAKIDPQETGAGLISNPYRSAQIALEEGDLNSLVNALVQSGISRGDIAVKVPKSRPRLTPFPFPSLGKAEAAFVLVKVRNPTRDKIESVMLTAENHLKNASDLSLKDIKVGYKINECEQLQLQAFEDAVGDAQKRAEAIAGAMKAKLSPSASVAEPFFNMFVPGCESGREFSLSGKKYNSYEPKEPIEVVVDRMIFFTYTID